MEANQGDTRWVAKPAPHAQGGTWGVKDAEGNWIAMCYPTGGGEAGRLVAMGRAKRIAALPALMKAAEEATKRLAGSTIYGDVGSSLSDALAGGEL